MKLKILFYDLETTGTRYWRSGIHQIAGILDINGEVVDTFNYKVRPNPAAEILDESLAVAGVTRDQVLQYKPMEETYPDLNRRINLHVSRYDKKDKIFLVGYNNAAFDNSFFRAWYKQNGDEYFGAYFWENPTDVYSLVSFLLMRERANLKDSKLKTVCRYFGIEVDETKLHDALYDITLTRDLYYAATKRIADNITAPREEVSFIPGSDFLTPYTKPDQVNNFGFGPINKPLTRDQETGPELFDKNTG